MKKTNMNHSADSITLAEETVSFGGMMLQYRLLAKETYQDRFRIRVTSGQEQTEASVGSDISSALNSYRAVVNGRVTPCCLHDVMYDLSRLG